LISKKIMSDDNTTLDKVEELREEVIEKYGLDEETQDELIEQITNEALETKKNTSNAIEQKSKYRQQLLDAGMIDPVTFKPIEKPKADADKVATPLPKVETKQENNQDTQGLTVEKGEDLVFLGMGGTQVELDVLRMITRTEQISLAEAKASPYFSLYKQNEEAKKKTEDAQLNASTASKSGTKKKKVQTREEHMEAVKNWKPSKS